MGIRACGSAQIPGLRPGDHSDVHVGSKAPGRFSRTVPGGEHSLAFVIQPLWNSLLSQKQTKPNQMSHCLTQGLNSVPIREVSDFPSSSPAGARQPDYAVSHLQTKPPGRLRCLRVGTGGRKTGDRRDRTPAQIYLETSLKKKGPEFSNHGMWPLFHS